MLEPQLLVIMIVQFRNENVSNHGSIPITIDCNVVAFIVFEEGFHQPIKRTKHHRAAGLLVRLVKGEERWEAPDHPQGVLPHNWGEVEPNNTITCLVLKAKT
ncbi:hypothetical protein TNCV_3160251 [Trichonephila clavipes]|nr:hypothetical protein TNCV_3160251 [Trichonephila clavipes]